ncbi:hypothetical protein FHS56_000347 [Thermonema lapsum]|uniref:Lipoprotein n=1 Tax=Thermonema lapsum TaxID=28195 RepID=A0A846MN27_9BACT|nr:hypothetical protein [Thermonema lapsum]NIK72861.1 hypothetical protein [Thermonema lapsum]
MKLLLKKNINILLTCILLAGTSACAKRCQVSGCMIVDDHTHFFGAENAKDGSLVDRSKVNTKDLKVYSGTVWWRRIFKKSYRTDEGKRYKVFDKEKNTGLDKHQINKISLQKQKGGFDK